MLLFWGLEASRIEAAEVLVAQDQNGSGTLWVGAEIQALDRSEVG